MNVPKLLYKSTTTRNQDDEQKERSGLHWQILIGMITGVLFGAILTDLIGAQLCFRLDLPYW